MLYILGIGSAAPATVISNSLLESFQSQLSFPFDSFIAERRSLINPDKLLPPALPTPKELLLEGVSTPTDLAITAATQALQRAGLSPEALGLVVGDGSTPIQVCPSEGQRVAGKFGLKIPAYDILGGSGSFAVHLDVFRKWREDKIPPALLAFTVHAPTHAVNFSKGHAAYFFGDGAAAYILSTTQKGPLRVVDTGVVPDPKNELQGKIGLQSFVEFDARSIEEFVLPNQKQTLEELRTRYGAEFSESYFVGPQFDARTAIDTATSFGFAKDRILTNGKNRGDCLGASAPSILSENWGRFESGRKVFVVQSGIGCAKGYVVLEVV